MVFHIFSHFQKIVLMTSNSSLREGAGSFKVGRVNEANFEACTGGGSLEVGSIKAYKAHITTEGGVLKVVRLG
jgi:hypothetical protein